MSAQFQKSFLFFAVFVRLFAIPLHAADLKPETVTAFERYVRVTETEMEDDLRDDRFLIVDRLPESERRKVYGQLHQGQIFIQELHTREDRLPFRIPSGLVHHWAGVIFIPNATLAEVNAVLQDYRNEPSIYKPEIRQAKLIEQDGDKSKIFLQLYNKSIITVVLNGYFDVVATPLGSRRSEIASRSTRIVEVVNPGSTDEHERTDGVDHGYMWRMNSYWRIEEKDGGVYVQNQSISLTRTVPVLLAWLIDPLTKSIPRDVLVHMLTDTQDAVLKAGAAPKPGGHQHLAPGLSTVPEN